MIIYALNNSKSFVIALNNANPPIYGDGGVLIFESFTPQNTYMKYTISTRSNI